MFFIAYLLFILTLEIDIVLKELQNQNKSVYKNVFNHFYKGLVVYANNFLFDQESSEDAVQEVFISLWENAKNIEIKTSLKAYLYAMVRNKCLNYLKSVKITDDLNVIDLNSMLVLEEDLDLISEEEKTILYHHILKIIETFPKSMQQVFKLKFIENYKYEEIADEMGISVNTVKTQLKRAKVKISESLVIILALLSIHS
ncbi:RNA polymerase sigma factor [Flavobacterium hibisci]|uniref:RNA polymerase sigma factor n=1 Tax=Flavobacterium hibisci TaxID=1914462 RepID=UPI001CBB8939|nr:RNA polymerase sigma-70 factor [Flavobacterium hibisci]MBZ4043690.1 RNA polymerase sigma-70 factor [Flavobacterium hibisci]